MYTCIRVHHYKYRTSNYTEDSMINRNRVSLEVKVVSFVLTLNLYNHKKRHDHKTSNSHIICKVASRYKMQITLIGP